MNPDKRKEIHRLFDEGLLFQKSKIDRLVTLPRKIFQGDLFLFPMPQPTAVKWCVIFSHSKNGDLWYVVPGDDFSPVGTRDVAVPEFPHEGPLNLRCGCGLWIHADDFNYENRIGQLDQEYVEQVRDHLARIVENDLPTAESLVVTDEEPEYIEWMEELSASVYAFEEQLLKEDPESLSDNVSQADSLSISPAGYSKNWFIEAGLTAPLSMAADSNGLTSLPSNDDPQESLGVKVEFARAGDLYLIKNTDGAYLFICNLPSGAVPPIIQFGDQESPRESWHATPDGFSTSLFNWSIDEIVIFVNGTPLLIKK